MKLDSCIRIGVVDDHELVRKGLTTLLNDDENLEVVLTAENGMDLQGKILIHPIEVLVLDLEMPVLNGFETIKWMKEFFPTIPIVVISVNSEVYSISEVMQLGASLFVPKDVEGELLKKLIKSLAIKGEICFELNKDLIDLIGVDIQKIDKHNSDLLTQREREIIELVCAGKKNKEIADTLYISKRTVEGHRNSIAQKTETSNIAELVVFALKNRLFSLN